jgi:hypothetical protein
MEEKQKRSEYFYKEVKNALGYCAGEEKPKEETVAYI